MKNYINKAFTLVELLVVITILAIISVVAYQSFGGATSKAISARKISDVATIESSLLQYKVDKNFYPKVDMYSATNMWGYDSSKPATPSNTLTVAKNGAEITAINFAAGGGKVMGIGTYASRQIGAKGTISQETLGKQYLSKDLFDPEISDIKVGTEKMIEKGIGRYVYAVYKKPLSDSWNENQEGTYYNIAYTIKKEGTDTFLTKIVGDYDSNSCFDNKNDCPATLIGSGNEYLVDGQEIGKKADGTNLADANVDQPNQGIPYPVQF